jgi:hypothetical protein
MITPLNELQNALLMAGLVRVGTSELRRKSKEGGGEQVRRTNSAVLVVTMVA